MLIAFTINNAAHQRQHGEAMRKGMERHGDRVRFIPRGDVAHDADVHVTWSVKRPHVFAWHTQTGKPVLVMERGHVGDRHAYTSCGWNGLGRRGVYPTVQDGGARWRERWGALVQPWRDGGTYALLIGQVQGDAALYGLTAGFAQWAQWMTDSVRSNGYAVRYRPHPLAKRNGDTFCPRGATYSSAETLAEDLTGAALCITYNSTAGVEAVLAGVPTVTMDEGAMAWPVTTHTVTDKPIQPDRQAWSHAMAWTQWSIEEIASGEAWAHLAPLIPSLRSSHA